VLRLVELEDNVVVVDTTAAFTVTETAFDVDPLSEASPEYDAVMLCAPAVSVLVLKLALPPESETEPRDVAPSWNVTIPVGVLVPDAGATAAVNVTDWPVLKLVELEDSVVVVDTAAAFTVTETAFDVEPLSEASPEYDAVMLCEPAVSVLVLKLAPPLESETEPRDVAPSWNVTVPVGVPVPEAGATAAVNDTDWPALKLVELEDSVVVVDTTAAFTVTETAFDVEPLSEVSPEYDAVMLCEPADSVLVLKLALPPESAAEPRDVAPSWNVTVPVGVPVPEAGATAAVNDTDWPALKLVELEDSVVVVATGALD